MQRNPFRQQPATAPAQPKTVIEREPDWKDLPEGVREALYQTALMKKSYGAERFAPRDVSDLNDLATLWYDSDLLPEAYYPAWQDKDKRPIKYSPEELAWFRQRGISRAIIVMRYGAALGVLPEMAIRLIYIIEGQPSPAAALMLAIFLASPVCAVFEPLESTKLKARVRVQRKGQKPFEVEATYEAYKHLHKKTVWCNYPEDMVFWRCVARALRRAAPDLFAGVYCAEERRDLREDRNAGAVEDPLDRIFDAVDVPVTRPRPAPEESSPEPERASATTETQEAPPVPSLTKQEFDEICAQIMGVDETSTSEEVSVLHARVVSWQGNTNYKYFVKAWRGNPLLGTVELPEASDAPT